VVIFCRSTNPSFRIRGHFLPFRDSALPPFWLSGSPFSGSVTKWFCDSNHRRPKLSMLSFFFPFYVNVQANVTYGMYYYITTEFDHAKHDSRLAAYGGVVLQWFEFIKVCMGMQRLCLKSQLFLYFVNKIYLPCCCVVFFVVCQLLGPI